MAECRECHQALAELPALLPRAARALAHCQQARDNLQAAIAALDTFLAGDGHLPAPFNSLAARPPSAIEAAQVARDAMNGVLTEFANRSAPCRHDNLVASCEECTVPGEIPALVPSGVVTVERSRQHLGRLATAFRSASRETTDPAWRARYDALASRLSGLPAERVLDVTAPAGEALSQRFVAVRPSSAPDDRRSPLAVVLTVIGSRRCPPELNPADRRLLDEALETFKNTLAPVRCPTCPPPR